MIGFPLDSHVTYKGDGTPVYDRAISSAPLRKIFKKLLTDGVLPNPSNNMKVQAGTGMQVIVNPGFANVDGCLKLEDSQRTLVVQASSTSYDRIDTVVLRLDANDDVRECDFYIVAGTPASTPVRPSLSRGESIYEIGLADIFVGANSTAITNDKITDTRLETARCGVISSISEFDTDNIYDQIMADLASFKANEQAEFLAWFEDLKNILDDNAAANLQNEIGTLTLLSTTAKSNLVAAINEVKSDADSGIASVESDVSTLESSMTTAQGDISALNQSLSQSLVDIDLKFDTATNKPMYRQHGVGEFVNFSGGFSNPITIVKADWSSDTSYTFTSDYSTVIFIVNTGGAKNGIPTIPDTVLKLNGTTITKVMQIDSQTYSSNIYGRVGTHLFVLNDVKSGDKVTMTNTISYGAFGQE